MNTLQAMEVIKNVQDRLEGLQVTVKKHLVDVKPMSDLSNWYPKWYKTYLKKSSSELCHFWKISRKGGESQDSILEHPWSNFLLTSAKALAVY